MTVNMQMVEQYEDALREAAAYHKRAVEAESALERERAANAVLREALEKIVQMRAGATPVPGWEKYPPLSARADEMAMIAGAALSDNPDAGRQALKE